MGRSYHADGNPAEVPAAAKIALDQPACEPPPPLNQRRVTVSDVGQPASIPRQVIVGGEDYKEFVFDLPVRVGPDDRCSTLYIGRGNFVDEYSLWANPFRLGLSSRDECISSFAVYLRESAVLQSLLVALSSRRLPVSYTHLTLPTKRIV